MNICTECQSTRITPVHNCSGDTPILKGWYCADCGTFHKAIGREKQLPIEKK